MSAIFDYIPHPHTEKRKETGPPKVAAALAQIHGPGPIGRVNAKIGLIITSIVGTMWCAYAFVALAFFGFPAALNGPQAFVAWASSQFIQLVLLPVIIVGQNIQAAAADARSQATYDDAAAVLEEAKQIQAHLAAQDAAIEKILTSITSRST